MKKIFIVLLSALAVVGLVGCKKKKKDPTTVPTTPVVEPTPGETTKPIETPVPTGAKVSFVDHRSNKTTVVEAVDGKVAKPADPTRAGFRFGGWFTTRRGLNWLETEALEFPLAVTEDTAVYAYWEPVKSDEANWLPGETYVSSMLDSGAIIMNPMVYEYSHEDDFINMLSTSLYATEVDWGLAIEEGVADFPGDFSKIEAGEYSIEAFDYHFILEGATEYPLDQNGETAVVDGVYDRDLARDMKDTVWTFNIREDLVFQDGRPIEAADFEYTLKNWVDPEQNNSRANMWYKTEANNNGSPVLNMKEYIDGEVTWEEVGFKVTGKYQFEFTMFEEIPLSSAVSLGNQLRLVHPEKYAASLDEEGINSKYGTPNHPYVSYGSYVVKSWDPNAKIVFNKNYDYVLKQNINYKSQVIEIVDNIDMAMDLFKNGELSSIGLTKDYYAEYAEDPGVKKSWRDYPQYLIVNMSNSTLGEGAHVQNTIIHDARFRQALFYGFDRNHYANNIYAPNTPSVLPIPLNAKHYLYDPLYFTQTPQFLELLDKVGIDEETHGFNATKAVDLFEEAYADWLAIDGNEGPITLRLVDEDDDFSTSLLEYIKQSYEALFEKDGVKRVIIDLARFEKLGKDQQIQSFNFDLTLANVGFGHAGIAYYQMAAFGLVAGLLGGASDFGLSAPFHKDGDMMDYVFQEITVDLSNTLAYLESLDEEDYSENYVALHEGINEEGIWEGELFDLILYLLNHSSNGVYAGGPDEPFAGASHDLSNITAVFAEIFFENVPAIPTATLSGATIYADNVVIEWPAYSEAFGWGAARYRYLNTDIDFQ